MSMQWCLVQGCQPALPVIGYDAFFRSSRQLWLSFACFECWNTALALHCNVAGLLQSLLFLYYIAALSYLLFLLMIAGAVAGVDAAAQGVTRSVAGYI